uniref:Zinc finger protein ZFPM1/2 PR domain-containing protein n=1 Tax=Strigops habroptila TaxID=2489341 RepID=A0A672UGC2_STRHB
IPEAASTLGAGMGNAPSAPPLCCARTPRRAAGFLPPTMDNGAPTHNELDLVVQGGERRVRTRKSLPEGFSWGPFQGSIHSELASPGHTDTVRIWLPISWLAPRVQTPGTG